jgi:pimeloyl-ACP methyl ester carboxylesterase
MAFVILLIAFLVGPFLVPLPSQPDRRASDVASDLGVAGELVAAGGTRAWVEEAGPADGPAVVLVHGFGGATWSWRATLPALARAGYRVIALDLANFGLSDKGWDLATTHQAQADLVAAVMDARGISSATLVGHSMGGNVVAWFAARHPDRLLRAALVDAATGPAAGAGGPGIVGSLVRLPNVRRIGQLILRTQVDKTRLGGILRSAYADPSRATEEALSGYVAPLQTANWDLGLLAVLRDSGASRLDAPIGDLLRVPTLVVWGRRDAWIPLESGEALRAALPDAEWRIIDDAGHLPMEEQPEAFNAALLAWLESTR